MNAYFQEKGCIALTAGTSGRMKIQMLLELELLEVFKKNLVLSRPKYIGRHCLTLQM
jgi:hypothetical protein